MCVSLTIQIKQKRRGSVPASAVCPSKPSYQRLITKQYGTPLLISDSVARKVEDKVPCRQVGKIVVKGLSRDIVVYEARKDLAPRELKGWDTYKIALEAYYEAKFSEAGDALAAAKVFMPEDPLTEKFQNLCDQYIADPPPSDWTGVEVMSEK